METYSYCADDSPENIIRKYSDTVYRLAFSLLKSQTEADDIHQEVFIRYLKSPVSFQSSEHAKAWFIRVTVNCCKNYWKSAWFRKRAPLEENAEMPEEQPDDRQEALIERVKTLPRKYRVVIHLFYFEDMCVEEISQLLHKNPSTVRTQLTRARALLKEMLKEEI